MENNYYSSTSSINNKINSVASTSSSTFSSALVNYGTQAFSEPTVSNNYTVYNNYPSSYPNPPINTVESTANKSEDQLWVDTWLSQIGKSVLNVQQVHTIDTAAKVKVSPKIPIHVAKSSLRSCLLIIERLQGMQENLKENAETMSSSEWKKKTLEIGILKDHFSKFISQFENPEAIAFLKSRVHKRRKKRLNQKSRKVMERESDIQEAEERQKLHKKIDQWLESKKEEVERTKADENMKKDADCVLAEVTKKKSDARKQLSLISALVKLRSVRESVAVQQGQKVSPEDGQAFSKTAEQLTKTWEDSLKLYMKEEQGLRCMLEQSAAEDTIAAQVANERRIIQEWETTLFGPKVIPTPIYWGLTCADKSLETFIAIRKSWDTFLTKHEDSEGSKIPVGWVLPDEDAPESWKKYILPPQ
ncbi:programmed cell death protein 7 [Agrilus planipennis]|uniref:Programmed cell death protein 7 n=1 Tax=Agrilus planipennis TaxID=224129 RepID=A0A1W4WJZ8_AGRPL|nr:programmed cell death protein 7 [Agrilus planipennis]